MVPIIFVYSYAVDQGISVEKSTLLISIVGVASLSGRLILGFVTDKIGAVNVLRFSLICLGLTCGLWTLAKSFAALVVFAIFIGFSAGAFIATIPVAAAQYFPLGQLASIIGYLYAASGVGNLVGPLIAGKLNDKTGSYVVSNDTTLAILNSSSSIEPVFVENYLASSMFCFATVIVAAGVLFLLPKPPPKQVPSQPFELEDDTTSSSYPSQDDDTDAITKSDTISSRSHHYTSSLSSYSGPSSSGSSYPVSNSNGTHSD